MQPNQLSSGDVIADRRADYARMLDESGDPVAAGELMEQALELAPHWAAGWFRLGQYRERSEQAGAAAQAYRHVLDLDPEDMFGASLKLSLVDDGPAPDVPPSRYVERLFDDYAERFETSLVEKLDYSVPAKLGALVAGTGRRYRLAVDLGCGTGLLGPEIRSLAERLEGFDLSKNMLAKAAEKRIYDHLAQADLSLSSDESGLFADGAPGRADLVAAADVFMYLGNLQTAFMLVATLAAPGAHFAFSVEDAGADGRFRLAPSLRYAHGERYIQTLCETHGFTVEHIARSAIRKDGGKPVDGILFLAKKAA